MNAQQELTDATVEGTAGGGLVTARLNGQGQLIDLTVSPRVIDLDDPAETAQSVADLVLAAVRDAYRAVDALQQEKMGPFASLGAAGQPGGGLPGIADLFGSGHEGGGTAGTAGGAGGGAPEAGGGTPEAGGGPLAPGGGGTPGGSGGGT
jgi:DNA-binding protein YbaB